MERLLASKKYAEKLRGYLLKETAYASKHHKSFKDLSICVECQAKIAALDCIDLKQNDPNFNYLYNRNPKFLENCQMVTSNDSLHAGLLFRFEDRPLQAFLFDPNMDNNSTSVQLLDGVQHFERGFVALKKKG